jgi:hypothetical protein
MRLDMADQSNRTANSDDADEVRPAADGSTPTMAEITAARQAHAQAAHGAPEAQPRGRVSIWGGILVVLIAAGSALAAWWAS